MIQVTVNGAARQFDAPLDISALLAELAMAGKKVAVERNGEAAAYPVRQLAYHHIVQDVVGGVPIVVTY